MSVNGRPHYKEYMNLSIDKLSKKFKKNVLKDLYYIYADNQYDNTHNNLNKLKKPELVKRLYELLHTEDPSVQESIAMYHSHIDKCLEEKNQQQQERQNKLSEYYDKLDEIESLMKKDNDFRKMLLERLSYLIDVQITTSFDNMW